jgi:hypothetical protein
VSQDKPWIEFLPHVGVLISVYFLIDAAVHAEALAALGWAVALGFGVYLILRA